MIISFSFDAYIPLECIIYPATNVSSKLGRIVMKFAHIIPKLGRIFNRLALKFI